MTLLEQCNADVFKAILECKAKHGHSMVGQGMINILQSREYWWQMTGEEILRFAAHLPYEIWNGKIHTFYLLFESQQTTKMP
jgi:hypothetical protein